MSERLKILRGGSTMTVAFTFSQGLTFLRNTMLIRMLGPVESGIAITFSMAISFLDMMSSLASDQQIIQADEQDAQPMQRVTQLISFNRGIFNGTIIFLFAGLIADFFDQPQATWAFRLVALIPVMRGLSHQDVLRVQRKLKFLPAILTELIPNGTITLLAWPMAHILPSYATMVWLLLIDMALTVIVSHLTAESPYRWSFNRQMARKVLKFGWPLLINGFLMFWIFNGDRTIVGAKFFHYSHGDLGIYSAALTLTMVPTILLNRVTGSILFPVIAREKANQRKVEKIYWNYMLLLSLLGALMAGIFMIVGRPLIMGIWSTKFNAVPPVLYWLGIAWAIRLLRSGPATAAMAFGETRNLMMSTVVRVASLSVTILLAIRHADLRWLAASAIIGESAAFVLSVVWLSRRNGLEIKFSIAPTIVLIVVLICAGLYEWKYPGASADALFAMSKLSLWRLIFTKLAITSAFITAIYLILFRGIRRELAITLAHIRRPMVTAASAPLIDTGSLQSSANP